MSTSLLGASAPIVFSFNSSSVRTIADDLGELWFLANDVCTILGYANTSQAVKKNCRDGGISKRYTPTESGDQEMLFINEPNLYRLIIKSRRPEAERFEQWVMEDVLPTIRKTGRYEPAPYTKNPGDTLSLEQAERLRTMLTDAANRLPEREQGPFLRAGWSKLKAHFKVAYRRIPAHEFSEAVSIVARHIAGGEQPAALPPPTERLLMERAPDGSYTVRPLSARVAIVEITDLARMQALVSIVADFAPRELLPELVATAQRRLHAPRHAALR